MNEFSPASHRMGQLFDLYTPAMSYWIGRQREMICFTDVDRNRLQDSDFGLRALLQALGVVSGNSIMFLVGRYFV